MQIATYVTLFPSLPALFVCKIRVPYSPAKNRLKFAEHRELSHGGVQHLMLCTNFVLATFRPFPIGKGDNTDGRTGVPKFEVAEGGRDRNIASASVPVGCCSRSCSPGFPLLLRRGWPCCRPR